MSVSDGRVIQTKDDFSSQMPVEPSEEQIDFLKILQQSEQQRSLGDVGDAVCTNTYSGSFAADGKYVSSLRDVFLQNDRDRDLHLTEDEIDQGLKSAYRGTNSHTVLQNMKDSFPALSILSGGDGDIEIGDIDRLGLLSAELTADAVVTRDAEFALANFEKIDSNGDGFLSNQELRSQCVSARDPRGSERSLSGLRQDSRRIADQSQDGAGYAVGISRADLAIVPAPERFNSLLFKTYKGAAEIDMVNKGITIGVTVGGAAGGLLGLGGGPLGVVAGVPIGALTGGLVGTFIGQAVGANIGKYEFEQNNATVRSFIEHTASGAPTLMRPLATTEPLPYFGESPMEKSSGSPLDTGITINHPRSTK